MSVRENKIGLPNGKLINNHIFSPCEQSFYKSEWKICWGENKELDYPIGELFSENNKQIIYFFLRNWHKLSVKANTFLSRNR